MWIQRACLDVCCTFYSLRYILLVFHYSLGRGVCRSGTGRTGRLGRSLHTTGPPSIPALARLSTPAGSKVGVAAAGAAELAGGRADPMFVVARVELVSRSGRSAIF